MLYSIPMGALANGGNKLVITARLQPITTIYENIVKPGDVWGTSQTRDS